MEENPKNFKMYINRIKKFINSLVIKIDEIYIHQVYHNYYKNHKQMPKREESKYYLNLAGKRHKDDPEVKININGKIYDFNKELLKERPDIKSVLLTYGNDFKKLVDNNPSMYTYIMGCLSIDMSVKKLLKADNYTILYYNKNYIENRELELIFKLENFIQKFFYNYNINEYIIDEFYLPSLLSILYNQLLLQTIVYKFDNILTYKADKYHLYNYLASFNNLDKQIDVFRDDTKYYVYGELNRIKTNIGQNVTLNKLLNKILASNRIGITNITTKINYKLNTELLNNVEALPIKKETHIISEDVNNATIIENNRKIELGQIIKLEKDNNYISPDYEVNEDVIVSELNRLNTHSQTKSYILDTPLKLSIYEINSINLVISNVLYLSNYNDNGFYFTYMDTYNKKVYNLDREDIYYIIVYLLLQEHNLLDVEDDIYITLDGIVDVLKLNKDDILNSTWYKKEIETILDFIIGDERLTLLPITKKDFVKRLTAIRRIDFIVSYLLSNITDSTLKTDIKLMINKIYLVQKLKIDKSRIINYIKDKNLLSMVKNTILKNFLEDLSLDYNGIEISTKKKAIGKLKKIVNFNKKVTSYNIQFLIDYNLFDGCSIKNYRNGITHGYKPFLNVKDGVFRLFEKLDYVVKTFGNVDVDRMLYNDWMYNNFNVNGEKIDVRQTKPIVVKNQIDYPLLVGNVKHRQPIYRTKTKENIINLIDNKNVNIINNNKDLTIDNTKVNYIKPVTGSGGIYSVLTASMKNWGHVVPYKSRLGNERYTSILERETIQLTSESRLKYRLTVNKDLSVNINKDMITSSLLTYNREGMLRKQATVMSKNEAVTSESVSNNLSSNININSDIIKKLNVKTFNNTMVVETVATDGYGYVSDIYKTRKGSSVNEIENLFVTNYNPNSNITTIGVKRDTKPTISNGVNSGLVSLKQISFDKLYSVGNAVSSKLDDGNNVVINNRINILNTNIIDELKTKGGIVGMAPIITTLNAFGKVHEVYKTRDGGNSDIKEKDDVDLIKTDNVELTTKSNKTQTTLVDNEDINNPGIIINKRAYGKKYKSESKSTSISEDNGLKYVNVELSASKMDGKNLAIKTAGPDTNPDEIDILLTSEKISD